MVLWNNGGDDFSFLTPGEEAQDPESPQPKYDQRQQNPYDIPLYWLVQRDPYRSYSGLL